MKNKSDFIGLIILVALLISLTIILSSQTYVMTILSFIGIYVIAASGLDLLFGFSGQISLGQAGFYAIGAYTSAILSMNLNIPVIISMFIGAIFATFIGIVLAYPASKLRHHFLSLTTIAFGEIVYLFIVYSPGDITQGFSGIAKIPPLELFGYKFVTSRSFFYVILFFMTLFLVVKMFIVDSRIGRAFIAIRDNTLAANGMGVNVRKYKIMSFAISAFFTGFAGALYTHMVRFISPETFTMEHFSIVLLTVVLFGGMASLWGPVIGAVVVILMKELLQVTGVYQMIIYGTFIVVVLLFMPHGIISFFQDITKNKVGKVVKADVKS